MKKDLLKSLRLLEDFIPYNYTDYLKLLNKNVIYNYDGTLATIIAIEMERVKVGGFNGWFTYNELFEYFSFLDGKKIGTYKKRKRK